VLRDGGERGGECRKAVAVRAHLCGEPGTHRLLGVLHPAALLGDRADVPGDDGHRGAVLRNRLLGNRLLLDAMLREGRMISSTLELPDHAYA
jgi:hypothetical protein